MTNNLVSRDLMHETKMLTLLENQFGFVETTSMRWPYKDCLVLETYNNAKQIQNVLKDMIDFGFKLDIKELNEHGGDADFSDLTGYEIIKRGTMGKYIYEDDKYIYEAYVYLDAAPDDSIEIYLTNKQEEEKIKELTNDYQKNLNNFVKEINSVDVLRCDLNIFNSIKRVVNLLKVLFRNIQNKEDVLYIDNFEEAKKRFNSLTFDIEFFDVYSDEYYDVYTGYDKDEMYVYIHFIESEKNIVKTYLFFKKRNAYLNEII